MIRNIVSCFKQNRKSKYSVTAVRSSQIRRISQLTTETFGFWSFCRFCSTSSFSSRFSLVNVENFNELCCCVYLIKQVWYHTLKYMFGTILTPVWVFVGRLLSTFKTGVGSYFPKSRFAKSRQNSVSTPCYVLFFSSSASTYTTVSADIKYCLMLNCKVFEPHAREILRTHPRTDVSFVL